MANIELTTLTGFAPKALFRVNGAGNALEFVSEPKRYVALLTQTGVNAPIATVLENTLGSTVVWLRDGEGEYQVTSTNAFPVNRTILLLDHSSFVNPNITAGFVRANDSLLGMSVINVDVTADNLLLNTVVEIRVYP
jgi:hypothetical protein